MCDIPTFDVYFSHAQYHFSVSTVRFKHQQDQSSIRSVQKLNLNFFSYVRTGDHSMNILGIKIIIF